jgi:hypothetical protein
MSRTCTQCGRLFTAQDLARDETHEMEADREAAGLRGVRFLYFTCPSCGADDIFVDVLPLRGEGDERFLLRRAEMEAVARSLHADRDSGGADVVVSAIERRRERR